VTVLIAHGIEADAPAGWDVRIRRRPAIDPTGIDPTGSDSGGSDSGGTTHAVMHAANFSLPGQRGDYGSGVVELMGAGHVLTVLIEFHPSRAGSGLYARQGLPRWLDPSGFQATSLQRRLPGQGGQQWFFTEAGRPWCLYVVLGSLANRARLVPQANQLVRGLRILGPSPQDVG
jgi:hypothetical protein